MCAGESRGGRVRLNRELRLNFTFCARPGLPHVQEINIWRLGDSGHCHGRERAVWSRERITRAALEEREGRRGPGRARAGGQRGRPRRAPLARPSKFRPSVARGGSSSEDVLLRLSLSGSLWSFQSDQLSEPRDWGPRCFRSVCCRPRLDFSAHTWHPVASRPESLCGAAGKLDKSFPPGWKPCLKAASPCPQCWRGAALVSAEQSRACGSSDSPWGSYT